MNNKKTKYAIMGMVLLLLGGTTGYFASKLIKPNQAPLSTTTETASPESTQDIGYSKELEAVLNNAINEKKVVKDSLLSDVAKRNNAGDYSLNTTISLLGYPVCVLESYDSSKVSVYSKEDEIKDLLSNISKNTKYTDDSFLQLYWMSEKGNTLITWIALNEDNMNDVKTIGMIESTYQNLDKLTVPTTAETVETFKDLSVNKETLLSKYKPMLYQVQNKLLSCKFTSKIMSESDITSLWNEYVLKTKDSYLFLNTKDDALYLVYESYFDVSNIKEYDADVLSTIKNGMKMEEFLKICPEARLSEVYQYSDSVRYTCYAVRSSANKSEIKYFNFNNGVLELDDKTDNTATPSETGNPTDSASETPQPTEAAYNK